MRMGLRWTRVAVAVLFPVVAQAQWNGFRNGSADFNTHAFTFAGSPGPEAYDSNQNYYDGDFADVDGDGLNDRALLARYGLLLNLGGGQMTPFTKSLNGYEFASAVGNDAVQFADVDNDGDYDSIQGGNGEPLVLQLNAKGRFTQKWTKSASALYIVNTDLERDGDVDLVITHSFCADQPCGGPVQFTLWVNDGRGNFTEESAARGLGYDSSNYIVAIASGDVDNDGDFDLVLSHGNSNSTVIAKNDGNGSFTKASMPLGVSGSAFVQTLFLGDLDDDGDLDVVVGGAAGPLPSLGVVVGINDGTGAFSDQTVARVSTAGMPATSAEVVGRPLDVDYDNDLDIVMVDNGSDKRLIILRNNGSGSFAYDTTRSMSLGTKLGAALGLEVDVSDVNNDGTYDIWVGLGGDDVSVALNQYQSSDGLPADVPRNVTVSTVGSVGIAVTWSPPPFAATARYYRVYRSTRSGLHLTDRQLVKIVGLSRHQDEGFSAPLTRHTNTARLNDASVTLDGANNRVTFTDASAVPGVRYHYSVVHVGTENEASAPSDEVTATLTAPSGADTTAPVLDIVSPSIQDWGAHPRIVLHYGDGQSGIDPATLNVSFDASLGARGAGSNLTDLAVYADERAFIAPLPSSLRLPLNTLVTMTARVADKAGNVTQKQVTFFVSKHASVAPTAAFAQSATSGNAPMQVSFDGSASADTGGKVVAWEWYFSDGVTLLGRQVARKFAYGGSYGVTLRVRNDQGGVSTKTSTLDLTGAAPPDDPDGGDGVGGGGSGGTVFGRGCNAVGGPPVGVLLLALLFAARALSSSARRA